MFFYFNAKGGVCEDGMYFSMFHCRNIPIPEIRSSVPIDIPGAESLITVFEILLHSIPVCTNAPIYLNYLYVPLHIFQILYGWNHIATSFGKTDTPTHS